MQASDNVFDEAFSKLAVHEKANDEVGLHFRSGSLLLRKNVQSQGYLSSYSDQEHLLYDSEEVQLALGVHLQQALVAFGAVARQVQRRDVETSSDLW